MLWSVVDYTLMLMYGSLFAIEATIAGICLALGLCQLVSMMPDKHERSIRRYKKLLAEAEAIRQSLRVARLGK
jgi:hypothetical protein